MQRLATSKKVLGVIYLSLLLSFGLASSGLAEVTKAIKPEIIETYGKLPLSFEANQGQTDSQVKFLSRGNGYTLFLTPTETVLVLKVKSKREKADSDFSFRPKRNAHVESPTWSVVRIKLIGANPEPKVLGLEELPGKSNYFIGNDLKNWRTNVPHYRKVKYEEIYPGVGLVYYGNQRLLEYDFIMAPGVDPKNIALEFDGAETATVDAQGDLVLKTTAGELRLRKPLIYQEANGIREKIPGGYAIHDKLVRFAVGSYDASRPLVIDPVLIYSTFLGGNDQEFGIGVAVDRSGNAYVTGSTWSENFPTTSGSFAPTSPDSFFANVFVSKLSSDGSTLIYSTFIGGTHTDQGFSIAVDVAGSAYVTGATSSHNFPTTPGAFQTTYGGGTDAFVTKLSPNGSALVYSAYLGGFGGDASGNGIAVDNSGSAYVTGRTSSRGPFPLTPGAFQTSHIPFEHTAFVTKISPDGSSLVYSTYLNGAEGAEEGKAVAVDGAGHAYITGVTDSNDFPTTAGAFQTTIKAASNAFVTKLNPAGSALVYSTYLGGGGNSFGGGIVADSSGNAYIAGSAGPSFPTTSGAFQMTFGGGFLDAFITKLNPSGSALIYSTYLGGGGADLAFGLAVDSLGQAYVTGGTESTNFPTQNPLQATHGGGPSHIFKDAFIAKLNASGNALIYSTYLGGSGVEDGSAITLDGAGSAYVTGGTNSANFPTTAGAFQTTPGGSFDVFLLKIPEINTSAGTNVVVQPKDIGTGATPVTLTFSTVTQAGVTSLAIVNNVLACHPGFRLGDPPQVYDLSTTAIFTGEITVCINYSGINFADESSLKLFHVENGVSVDRTTSLDTTNNIICAIVTSLSPFGCCQPDNRPPNAICQGVTVNADANCRAGASINNGSNDPDSDPIMLVQTPAGPPATPFRLGKTLANLTVTDNEGASNSCSAIVTVVDNENPLITCPAPQVIECTGPGGASATVGSPIATDNCGVASAGCSPSSGTFPIGTTNVSCSTRDSSGNSSSCGSRVTVRDTTAPAVSCVPVPRVKKGRHDNDDDDKEKFRRQLFQVSASDICGAFTITLGGHVLGNGEIIKITRTERRPGVRLVGMEHGDGDDDDHGRRANFRHFLVGPGEAVIKATDAAGNIGSVACPLPQRRGDKDDDDRGDFKKGKK